MSHKILGRAPRTLTAADMQYIGVVSFISRCTINREGRTSHAQLRLLSRGSDQYRALAEAAEDAATKQEYLELAAVCEEVADQIDDCRASG